tara:strand:- start:2099 stop:2293 length:195 start_codon:yes stop_codon:yes gene_type:complete
MTFLHTLKVEERDTLRKIVKNVHMKYFPKDFCTDYEADKLIASIGPETIENLLKVGKKHDIRNI